MTTPTWWVARDKHKLNSYILSASKPYKRKLNEDTTAYGCYFYRRNALTICAIDWHRAGGPRLKPGQGPGKVIGLRLVWDKIER